MPIYGSVARALRRVKDDLPEYYANETQRGGQMFRDEVRQRTPIGRIVDRRTGRDLGPSGALRRSIRPHPVVRTGPRTWRSGVYSLKDYASHVEYGTKRHVIRGNNHLAFWSRGQLFIRQKVNHPGAPGRFMFALAAPVTDREFERAAEVRLQFFLRARFR